MPQQNLGFVAAGGHQVQNSVGQAGLFPELGNAHGRLRHKTGHLQHHAVSRGDADGSHPSVRNHGRKVPRRNAGKDAQGFAELDGIVAGGDVPQRLALHHLRSAAGKLHNLNRFENISCRFVPLLAVFLGAKIGELIQVLVEQLLHFEEHLGALGHGRVPPCWKGLCGGLNRLFHLFGRTLRRMGNNGARRGVVAWHVLAGLGFTPNAARQVLQLFGGLAADGIGLGVAGNRIVTIRRYNIEICC